MCRINGQRLIACKGVQWCSIWLHTNLRGQCSSMCKCVSLMCACIVITVMCYSYVYTLAMYIAVAMLTTI